MKMVQDSTSGLKSQEFLITEYMTQINLITRGLLLLIAAVVCTIY